MFEDISFWQLGIAAVIGMGVILLIAGPAGLLAGGLLANLSYGALGAALGSGLFLGAKAIGFHPGGQDSAGNSESAIVGSASDSRNSVLSIRWVDKGIKVSLDDLVTQKSQPAQNILAEDSQRSPDYIRTQLKRVLDLLPPAISDKALTVRMDKNVPVAMQQEIENTLREMGSKINVEVTQ